MTNLHPLYDDEPGMIKLCRFPAKDAEGQPLIEMIYDQDQFHHSYMDKVAAPYLPEIREYVDRLKPQKNSIYALINALGAYEYWSSNINGDAFEEEMLTHKGPVWGYETFVHYARPYMHHSNKGPDARAFGSVELSCWNPNMKRVEVVARLDREDAVKVNAQSVIDKVDRGELPETSMGTKVPYDLCSITTDWDTYRRALSTFDPRVHRHPGVAVLNFHKRIQQIRGLSINKDDYTEYTKYHMNSILPDGRKVFVYNPYPRFFDISFVFIGAEKTSKMMAKLASSPHVVVPAQYPGADFSYEPAATHKSFEAEKVASISSTRLMLRKMKEKKASQYKQAEIIKDIVPSQFMSKAVPLLEKSEPPLDRDVLDQMGSAPLGSALSTPTMMGIVLKPQEFQRITLNHLGHRDLADDLDSGNRVFRPVSQLDDSISMGPSFISQLVAQLLKGSIEQRSSFGPPLTRRMIRITICGMPQDDQRPEPEPVEDGLLDKISAAYNGYREQVIDKIASLSQCLYAYPEIRAMILDKQLEDVFTTSEKTAAGVDMSLLLGAIPATYLMSSLARRSVNKDYNLRRQQPGILKEFLADHPHLAATAVGLAALKAGGSTIPDKLLQAVLSAGKYAANIG